MVVFSEKPSLSDRKTYFIWDKPTLSNYCDNGLPYAPGGERVMLHTLVHPFEMHSSFPK